MRANFVAVARPGCFAGRAVVRFRNHVRDAALSELGESLIAACERIYGTQIADVASPIKWYEWRNGVHRLVLLTVHRSRFNSLICCSYGQEAT